MTKDKDEKAVIRARMQQTGESYAAARAQLGRGSAKGERVPSASLVATRPAAAAMKKAELPNATPFTLLMSLADGEGTAAGVLRLLDLDGARIAGWQALQPSRAVDDAPDWPLRAVIAQAVGLANADGRTDLDTGVLLRAAVAVIAAGATDRRLRSELSRVTSVDLAGLCARVVQESGPETRPTNEDGTENRGMFERFTDKARQAVVHAQEEARDQGHNWIGTEHLLLGMLRSEGIASTVLKGRGMTLEQTRREVMDLVGPGTDLPSGHIPFTPRAKTALENSLRTALDMGHDHIGTEHLLLGVLGIDEGVACQVLADAGVSADLARADVLELLRALTQAKDDDEA